MTEDEGEALSVADAMKIMREGHERYEARLRARRSEAARLGWATRRAHVAEPVEATCVVCRERPAAGTVLCQPCARSFRGVDSTHAAVIQWTADRALRFERQRQKKTAKSSSTAWLAWKRKRRGT